MEIFIIVLVLLLVVGYYLFSTMQEMRIKRAEKAVENGDIETALSIFMNSLRKNPEDVEALWHLGNINEEKHHFPEAIGYYTKLIEIGKDSKLFTQFELYRRVGLLYRRIGRDQDALDFLFQAYNMIQSSKDVLENIAMIIYTQKNFYRAIPYFEKTLQFTKNRPDILKHNGLCLIMADRLHDSLNLLEESVRQGPADVESKFLLAYVYFRENAFQKSREMLEEIINSEKVSLSADQFYFAVKILLIIYLKDKQFDIVKELIQQMKNINADGNETYTEEQTMAYIFFRVKQGYFDVALEEIGKNINLKTEIDKLDAYEQQKIKEGSSHLYELVSILDRYKKEKEKALYTGNKNSRMDVEFSMVESKAIDAQKEMDQMFLDWEEKFISSDPLWAFFGPKPKVKFDPALIIDKYNDDNIKALKRSKAAINSAQKEPNEKVESTGLDSKNPCESMLSADFPTFLQISRKIAENMGFKIINQAVKIDPMAYSEGQAADLLCQEKFQKDSRVLFCIRRWREPIGYLSVMTIMGAYKTLQANRLVIISSSPLSAEASRAIENNQSVNFYLCDDIVNYMV